MTRERLLTLIDRVEFARIAAMEDTDRERIESVEDLLTATEDLRDALETYLSDRNVSLIGCPPVPAVVLNLAHTVVNGGLG